LGYYTLHMNWLAKINLTVVIERLGPFKSAFFLVILMVLCLFTGYRLGNFYHHFQTTTLAQQKDRLEYLYREQALQVERIHTLEVELAVEQLANKDAQVTLKEMAAEHYQVKELLGFYEKVMSPEKGANGLVIDNVKISASQSLNHYNFKITLVQQQLKRRYAKGYVDIRVTGSFANKPSQLTLAEISTVTKKNLSFSFKYFQVISGGFTLPNDFIAETIQVSAILTKSKWQKYQKLNETLPWNLE
jgi:hypothetical protein